MCVKITESDVTTTLIIMLLPVNNVFVCLIVQSGWLNVLKVDSSLFCSELAQSQHEQPSLCQTGLQGWPIKNNMWWGELHRSNKSEMWPLSARCWKQTCTNVCLFDSVFLALGKAIYKYPYKPIIPDQDLVKKNLILFV